jgi:hypothetical protein
MAALVFAFLFTAAALAPVAAQATPEARHAMLASQIDLWRPIIEKAGIQAE